MTKANERLFQYWKNFCRVLKVIQPHEIWIVGDAYAGTQIFEKTRRTLTQNLEEQKAMFVALFEELL
jgi:hypothetical protein